MRVAGKRLNGKRMFFVIFRQPSRAYIGALCLVSLLMHDDRWSPSATIVVLSLSADFATMLI